MGHARLQEDKITKRNNVVTVSPDFKWRFQKFKRPLGSNKFEVAVEFGNQNNKETIYGGLIQPIENLDVSPNKEVFETNMGTYINAKDHIEHASLKEFLQTLAEMGFEEAAEAVKEEVL